MMDCEEALPHLLSWASSLCSKTLNNVDDFWESISEVLHGVQPNLANSSQEEVVTILAQVLEVQQSFVNQFPLSFGVSDTVPSLEMTRNSLRLLLACAVRGSYKEDHVTSITNLEMATQRGIMYEIASITDELEKVREAEPMLEVEETSGGSDVDNEADQDNYTSDIETSELGHTNQTLKEQFAMLSVKLKRMGRENVALKGENKDLSEDNTTLRTQVDQMQAELCDLKQMCSNSAIKNEIENQKSALKREQELLRSNETLTKELEDLKEEVKLGTKAKVELERLRDETEVLQAEASKVKKLSQSIERLKSKLEDSAGLRNQLDEALQKNQELINRSLDYDENMLTIQNLHREVDSLRRSQTDTEIALSEAKALCRDKDAEINDLIERCTMLEHNEQVAARENASLHQDLQNVDASEIGAAGSMLGLGAGLTELNPEVSEEMARLRRENQRLMSDSNSESKEAFAELSRNCDKLERLKDHFETEFRSSKKHCEKLQAELEDFVARNQGLEDQLAATKAQLEITQSELEDRNEELEQSLQLCAQQKMTIESLEFDTYELMESLMNLETETFALSYVADQMQNDASEKLAATIQQYEEEMEAQQVELSTQLEQARAEHSADQTRLETTHKHDLCIIQTQHEEELAAIRTSYEQTMQTFQDEHSVSNSEFKSLLEEKDNETKLVQGRLLETNQDLENCRVELDQVRSDAAKERERLESCITTINDKLEVAMRELEEARNSNLELDGTLSEYKEAFAIGKSRLETSARDIQDLEQRMRERGEELDQCKSQLVLSERKLHQSQKQCQALQMQQSEAARALDDSSGATGAQVREMREEIERLVNEKQRMARQLEELRAEYMNCSPQGSSDGSNRGVRELIRNYESKIMDLEKEKNAISLGRTNEMSLRFDAEKKLSKAMEELESVKAALVQYQLRAERSRLQEQTSETVLSDNKENHRISSKSVTDNLSEDSPLRKARKAAVLAPSNILSPARVSNITGLDPNIASLRNQAMGDGSGQDGCNQQ